MNKGFAVRPGPLSLSVMECHRPVFIDLFREACYTVTLKIAPDPPQKSPQSTSSLSRGSVHLSLENSELLDLPFAVYNQWGARLCRQLASSPSSPPQRGFHAGESPIAVGVFLLLHDFHPSSINCARSPELSYNCHESTSPR